MDNLGKVFSEQLLQSFCGEQSYAEGIDKNYFVFAVNQNGVGQRLQEFSKRLFAFRQRIQRGSSIIIARDGHLSRGFGHSHTDLEGCLTLHSHRIGCCDISHSAMDTQAT